MFEALILFFLFFSFLPCGRYNSRTSRFGCKHRANSLLRFCCFFPPRLSSAKSAELPLHMVYVPSHLYHMLFELFKVREKHVAL